MPHPDIRKRLPSEIEEKGEKIGKLLDMEQIPTHLMAWKEPRLNLPGGGECLPLIDVLLKLSERCAIQQGKKDSVKKPGRPKKKDRIKNAPSNDDGGVD